MRPYGFQTGICVAILSCVIVRAQIPGGSAIMYRIGKVLKTGGISTGPQPSLNTSYVFDYSQSTPTWRQVGSMNEPRTYHTLTALPDGNVLVTGGVRNAEKTSAQGALSAEVWNPTTETWTQLSSAQVKRSYHSTALLLPDGRVLVSGSGGDAGGWNHQSPHCRAACG